MTAPFVVTSRLGNILQMISLSRQTGILRVIRGQGATREMGQIRFIDGEPVSALLGQLTGEAALGVLSNWGECYYAFDELSVADVAGLASLRNTTNAGPGAGPGQELGAGFTSSNPATPAFGPDYSSVLSRPSPTTPLSDVSWPVYSYQQSGLFSSSGSDPLNSFGAGSDAQSQFPPPSSYAPEWSAPQGPAQAPNSAVVSTALLTTVPRRTPLAEQIDHLPLDRRERMVLLLIDGQRTVADLARLTRRTEAELQGVLTHLELLRLVSLGG